MANGESKGLEGIALPLFMCASLAVLVMMAIAYYTNKRQDDAYIFYSYARNIAAGNGYVFNAGERINATTSPLYTLLLAALAFVTRLSLPMIGHLCSVAFLCTAAWLASRLLRGTGTPLFRATFFLLFIGHPLITHGFGMESFLVLTLAATTLIFYHQERYALCGAAAGLTVLARPDGVVLLAVLAAHRLWRHRKAPPLRALVPFLVVVLPWLLFSQLYFGTILPTTIGAKVGQTAAGYWGHGLVFARGLLAGGLWIGPGFALIHAVGYALVAIVLWRSRAWLEFNEPTRILLIWSGVYWAAYVLLNPPPYSWYFIPLVPLLACASAKAAEVILRALCRTSRALALAVSMLLVAVVLAVPIKTIGVPLNAKPVAYEALAKWLNEHVPPGTRVAYSEVGALRYFYERGPVIDALGLVTPNVADHVRKGDFGWYIWAYHPDVVVFRSPLRPLMEDVATTREFRRQYELSATINKVLSVYARRDYSHKITVPASERVRSAQSHL